jgi:hypothetical protein
MKKYLIFPTGFAIAMGTAIGTATQNLAVGIAITIAFTLIPHLKKAKTRISKS